MEKSKKFNLREFMINYGVIMVMFVLVIYTGLTSKNFFTMNNFANILANMSYRVVIALGIAGCVITGGCDLSAGRMIGFSACLAGTLLQKIDYAGKFFPGMAPLNPWLVLLIVMVVAAAFGSVTGRNVLGVLTFPPSSISGTDNPFPSSR